MPPSALRSRNFAIGEAAPSGWMNSILVLGRATNTVIRQRHRFRNVGAERGAIDSRGLLGVLDGNRHMIEPAQHGKLLRFPYSLRMRVAQNRRPTCIEVERFR